MKLTLLFDSFFTAPVARCMHVCVCCCDDSQMIKSYSLHLFFPLYSFFTAPVAHYMHVCACVIVMTPRWWKAIYYGHLFFLSCSFFTAAVARCTVCAYVCVWWPHDFVFSHTLCSPCSHGDLHYKCNCIHGQHRSSNIGLWCQFFCMRENLIELWLNSMTTTNSCQPWNRMHDLGKASS